ncbi:MAG: VWA domain-containing protein [Alphaproteobacteria bacterium]|nr:VWA domain-containing protein [Alphaproteobacteria bacterium]
MGTPRDKLEFEFWEPEETVGKIWHALASGFDAQPAFDDASVSLEEMHGRLVILFRGLGGERDVEIKPAPLQESPHRLSRRRSLGQSAERLARASFDGESLRLPAILAVFPHAQANRGLYLWLTAASVFSEPPPNDEDPLRADVRALQAAHAMTEAVLCDCPGLRRLYANLRVAARSLRRPRSLPAAEAAMEAAILHLLGDAPPADPLAQSIARAVRVGAEDLSTLAAPRGYRTFMPVPLWPDLRAPARRQKVTRDDETPEQGQSPQDQDERMFNAKRKSADQAARKDSLVLHKFEAIFSWAEFLNINRRIEDDDEDTAKKAADDQDEISLTQVPQRARARLRLHLDLSPEEADFERLAGEHVYPEWDHRKKDYLPDYCRVLAGPVQPAENPPEFLDCPKTQRRIRQVRRQFEALRPKRVHLNRQIDGEEIDIEAAVEARVELAARGAHSDRVYRASRSQERDLAVSILLDASRSTESIVAGRQVIDIAREALIALAWGLDACGDATSIDAFSSLRRDRVFVHSCKSFEESMSSLAQARIASLRPGHYTRLGAAIRHVSQGLADRPNQRRLLLVLTDGKPNDLDHYEGRHGIEDTHMAVREARRRGQSVFGITIDAKSQASFSRIFGSGGFVVIPDPERLTAALPQIYSHLVGQ